MSQYPIYSPATYMNPIPPRQQWNHNGGYCGETSFIAAGLYYGQYLSQYNMRAIASPGMAQNKVKNGSYAAQLLLGDNAGSAADRVRLSHESWPGEKKKDTTAFINWIKQHVIQRHPVIMGVFNNITLLDEESALGKGDPQYDHIVPVLGFGTGNKDTYDKNDVIIISDNGLYTPGNSIPFYHQFRMKPENSVVGAYPFLGQRKAANNVNGNIYSLLKLKAGSKTKKSNFAIAITGVADKNSDTKPVRLTTNQNYEIPGIKKDSAKRPKASKLTLGVTVSDLSPGKKYNLYRYNDETKVPVKNFNKYADKAFHTTTIKADKQGTYETSIDIKSNEKVFFRAVGVDAS